MFDAHENAFEKDAYSVVEFFHRRFFNRARHTDITGVVEEAVQTTEVIDGKIYHCFDIRFLADIGVLKDGV